MNEFELRRRLRALCVEQQPSPALWQGIAGRLGARPQRRRPLWLGPALAASVALALVIAIGSALPTLTRPPSDVQQATASTTMLPRVAEGLGQEYRAALASLPPPALSGDLQATARLLDDSALELRLALVQQPQSVFLLDQLRRVYALRLQIGRAGQLPPAQLPSGTLG